MNEYRHHVSGIFLDRGAAEQASRRLFECGIPRERQSIYSSDPAHPDTPEQGRSNAILKDILVDGAIGTAVGTSLGAIGQVALVAANVSLFVASPLVAPLVMLGWGASLGATVGAAVGAVSASAKKEGTLSALVRDAIAAGQIVLVVRTRSEQESAMAREVIQTAVGQSQDVSVTPG